MPNFGDCSADDNTPSIQARTKWKMAAVVDDFPKLSQEEVMEHSVKHEGVKTSLSVTENSNPAVVQEWLRRDQRGQIYKAVPLHVDEIDSFFFDADGNCIWQDLGRRREPGVGLRYRTLPRKMTKLWPLVKRIMVFEHLTSVPAGVDESTSQAAPTEFEEAQTSLISKPGDDNLWRDISSGSRRILHRLRSVWRRGTTDPSGSATTEAVLT